MDILELMRDDHFDSLTTVRELLLIADRMDARERVALLLERLRDGLELHVESEKVTFAEGPRRRRPELEEFIQRSAREHQLITRLVRLCSSAPPCADLRLKRALHTLEDVLAGHVTRAQYQLFQVLYDDLDREERHELGRTMMAEQVRILGSRGATDDDEREDEQDIGASAPVFAEAAQVAA